MLNAPTIMEAQDKSDMCANSFYSRTGKSYRSNFLYVCKMRGFKVRHAVTRTSLLLYLTLENSGFRIHNGKYCYLGSINRLFT